MLTAVLEVSGAILTWPTDDPAAPPEVTFTGVGQADWLWRVVGEAGHLAALEGATEHLAVDPGVVAPLRDLAIGHWLRRWWPASARDGIVALDPALLDAEIAVRTAAADAYFTDDTLDSDVAALLAPHAAALTWHLAGGDPRVESLVRQCAELAEDLGVTAAGWPELVTALDDSRTVRHAHRDEYALAAGPGSDQTSAAVVHRATTSVNWAGVPVGVFDAAENTVTWSVVTTGAELFAVVAVDVAAAGPAAGIPVRLDSGSVGVTGVLDGDGRTLLALPLTESAAWAHDWSTAAVTVGADVEETAQARDRMRAFARTRLAAPPAGAYLAEALAAESDY